MKMRLITIVAKFVPVYTCDVCGVEAPGDTRRVELGDDSIEGIAKQLKAVKLRATHMPEGWSSYYGRERTQYRCPKCAGRL